MTSEEADTQHEFDRRSVLLGVGALGVAAALAACGDSDDDQPESPLTSPADEPESPPTSPSDDDQDDDGGQDDDDDQDDDDNGVAAALVAAAEVPVNGGVVLGGEGVVVTQPSDGQFRGFSSTCTHQGCTLARVDEGLIQCDCHGSRFSIEDGTVANGPATQPLPEVAVTLDGDQVVRA